MANYNTKSVKDLPQLEEIVDGNYLIVENQVGTNIIDFADFVIGPNNASFYSQITTLSSKQTSMSATVDTKFQTLTSSVLSATNTKIAALTANYPRYFVVYPNTLTVINGLRAGQAQFNSELASIVVSDITVVPTNNAAAAMTWFLLLSSIQNPGNPPNPTPYTYTITISSINAVAANATFETKVVKYY
jgi:hypothetical protein